MLPHGSRQGDRDDLGTRIVTSAETQNGYHLLFEGTRDDAPDTLRQIKIVFLADLDLSVEQTQQILASGPSVIRSAQGADDLEPLRKRLSSAGALVHIVAPNGSTEANASQLAAQGSALEFSIEMDTTSFEPPKAERPAKVYELPMEDGPPLLDLSDDSNDDKLESLTETTPDTAELARVNNELLDLSSGAIDVVDESQRIEISATPTATGASISDDPASALGLSFDEPASEQSSVIESVNAPHNQNPAAESPMPQDFGSFAISEPEPDAAYSAVIPSVEEEWSDADLAPPELLQPHTPQIPASLSQPQAAPPPPQSKLSQEFEQPAAVQQSNESGLEEKSAKIESLEAKSNPEQPTTEDQLPTQNAEADPQTKRSKAKGSRNLGDLLPLDVLLPVALSLAVLGVGNWWYFSGAPNSTTIVEQSATVAPITGKVAAVGKTPSIPKAASSVSSIPPQHQHKTKVRTYQIASDVGNLHLQGELLTDGDRLFVKELRATVDDPPLPTTAEIVAKKPRAPVITKIEIQDVLFEPASPGFFVGTGIAKLYIDYRDNKSRLVTKTTLKAQFAIDNASITVELQAAQGRKPDGEPGLKIDVSRDGGFLLSMQANATATLVKIGPIEDAAMWGPASSALAPAQ